MRKCTINKKLPIFSCPIKRKDPIQGLNVLNKKRELSYLYKVFFTHKIAFFFNIGREIVTISSQLKRLFRGAAPSHVGFGVRWGRVIVTILSQSPAHYKITKKKPSILRPATRLGEEVC